MRNLKREQLLSISVGQTGLYEWDKTCPVVEVFPVREVLYGNDKGKLFRYVMVASSTGNATIGFNLRED